MSTIVIHADLISTPTEEVCQTCTIVRGGTGSEKADWQNAIALVQASGRYQEIEEEIKEKMRELWDLICKEKATADAVEEVHGPHHGHVNVDEGCDVWIDCDQ